MGAELINLPSPEVGTSTRRRPGWRVFEIRFRAMPAERRFFSQTPVAIWTHPILWRGVDQWAIPTEVLFCVEPHPLAGLVDCAKFLADNNLRCTLIEGYFDNENTGNIWRDSPGVPAAWRNSGHSRLVCCTFQGVEFANVLTAGNCGVNQLRPFTADANLHVSGIV